MTHPPRTLRAVGLSTALAALTACSGGQPGMLGDLDWDLRRGASTFDTTEAARQATAARPMPDANGVISYPGYQVAVARRGDTVGSVAARIGLNPAELASYNAIQPNAPLRDGEVLALPRRVAAAGSGAAAGAVIGGGTVAAAPLPSAGGGAVSVTSIATTALDRVDSSSTAARPVAAAPNDSALGAMAPTRHQVKRGETAFSIARMYNVSARALADWNGLGADLEVREGQYLMIPTPSGAPPAKPVEVVTAPGAGSPTPEPPSAAKPLPDEKTPPAAQAAQQNRPASPDLGQNRTSASAAQFAMPTAGNIIRGYAPPKNEGIDIAAPAGTPVKAAAAGTVAAITQDTAQTPIIVIRHEGGLLTVYAGVAGITVKKGDTVTKGQTIANVRSGNPSFLHFEVRRGAASTDPMPFLR